MSIYYSEKSCPTYKLVIELLDINEDTQGKVNACKKLLETEKDKNGFIPSIEDVVFKKSINSNKMESYSSSWLSLFFDSLRLTDGDKDKENKETNIYNPESNLTKGLFVVKTQKEKEFIKEYPFTIDSSTNVTVVLSGISHITNISLAIKKITDDENGKSTSQVIAKDNITSLTTKQILNLILQKGKI